MLPAAMLPLIFLQIATSWIQEVAAIFTTPKEPRRDYE